MRTTVLLRYLNEPELREGITAVTNRVEAFHGFSSWLRSGNNGTLADNDPDHMELLVKFNELLANCVIFYNAVAVTAALTQLRTEGHRVYGPDAACLAPYMTAPSAASATTCSTCPRPAQPRPTWNWTGPVRERTKHAGTMARSVDGQRPWASAPR